MGEPVLRIEGLHVWFRVYGGLSKVLNGVNLEVHEGERVALVGETGCGKTTTAKAVLRILPRQAVVPRGRIVFKGIDVLSAGPKDLRRIRGQGISMIFQDPTASLSPVFTVGDQMYDCIRYSRVAGRTFRSVRQTAINACRQCALPDPERLLQSYPFQLSGGMRQRVCIAMALATARHLIIADEPTTNLDVTIQDQVLRLIRSMVEQQGVSLLLITHSLGVAREMTDRVYVMYAGSIVEVGPTRELFEHPQHPYTRGLLGSIPKLSGGGLSGGIPGRVPNYLEPPSGCRFHPRCEWTGQDCRQKEPSLIETREGHFVACHKFVDG